MSRGALLAFSAVVAVGLIGLVVVAGLERRSEAFTLGVVPGGGVVRLAPGREVCQEPIQVVEEFSRLRVQLGTFARPGPLVMVEVRDLRTGTSLAHERVEGGYPDNAVQTVTLTQAVPHGRQVGVCLRNLGDHAIAPYGNSGVSNRSSEAYLDGRRLDVDMAIVFLRDETASVLGRLPSIVDRASLFHGSWASTGAYWVLLAALLLGTVSLSALAVRAAVRDSS